MNNLLRKAVLLSAAILPVYIQAQTYTAATLPTGNLLSEAGPTFRIADSDLPSPLALVAYGDQR
ncbi:MAG: hypothetical protein JWO80_2622, partial [Bryobacterales bacterium]|nr:hypothetical protein [Bryobacterales bacterium]